MWLCELEVRIVTFRMDGTCGGDRDGEEEEVASSDEADEDDEDSGSSRFRSISSGCVGKGSDRSAAIVEPTGILYCYSSVFS